MILEFRGMGENTFWKFQRRDRFKYGSCPWYGMDIFWNNKPYP